MALTHPALATTRASPAEGARPDWIRPPAARPPARVPLPEPRFVYAKPKRGVARVFLHCSASDRPEHDGVATMRRWHMDPPPAGRGWDDVGYHFFIRKDGALQRGRPLDRTPAAQANHNTGTIAICLHGHDADKFTRAQFDTLVGLCRQIDAAHGKGALSFHGHREVAARACPVFPYAKVLKLDRFGRLGA
jgi:hypothetical protein